MAAWYPIGYHADVRLASLIATARARAGLTLRDLGAEAGTSHPAIAAYEAGRKDPGSSTLERIVGAAGFDIDVVLRPRPDDLHRRGRELVDVLELAAEFPARHDPVLRAPIFGR